jgi:hypothetical protein
MLLSVDRALRRLGAPGFETQTLVWLDRRLPLVPLRAALARLARQHPLLTARLVEVPDGGRPWWRLRPDAPCGLTHAVLASAEPAAVLAHAGRLLAQPTDPTANDPVRFHLLARPQGKDVLLVQFNHALMDHNQILTLLRDLNRLWTGGTFDAPAAAPADLVRAYLRRFPRRRRRAAMQQVEALRRTLKGGAIQLGKEVGAHERPARLALTTRRLDAGQTRTLEEALQRQGIPSLSMAVLASAFRMIRRLAGPQARGRYFCTGVGVELAINRAQAAGLQNLTSLVPIVVPPEDVQDRDHLACTLAAQLRQRLAADTDLGILAGAALLNRRPAQAGWLVEILLRHTVSLWYGYFGALDSIGPDFCGAGVEEVFSVGPAWAPVGLTLLVNKYRGRLLFQATYLPAAVPEPVVGAFLDAVLDDLRGWGA